jgi:hypothetical protein
MPPVGVRHGIVQPLTPTVQLVSCERQPEPGRVM